MFEVDVNNFDGGEGAGEAGPTWFWGSDETYCGEIIFCKHFKKLIFIS